MWHGFEWTVTDEDELATMIAKVALGQAMVVERVLRDTGCMASRCTTAAGRQGARRLLCVDRGSSAHRDGWMFQVISWIASHLQASRGSNKVLIRPPHMIHAEKGSDGLLVEYSEDSKDDIARVVVCEDKATENPRKQIRTRVLPEFDVYETGARDNELIAGVTSILGRHGVADADDIVANILWDERRAYRIAVTVGANGVSRSRRLFDGYAASVRGDASRRRTELLPLAELRTWMDRLAEKALDAIDKHHV